QTPSTATESPRARVASATTGEASESTSASLRLSQRSTRPTSSMRPVNMAPPFSTLGPHPSPPPRGEREIGAPLSPASSSLSRAPLPRASSSLSRLRGRVGAGVLLAGPSDEQNIVAQAHRLAMPAQTVGLG